MQFLLRTKERTPLSCVIDGIIEIKSCKIYYAKSIGSAGNRAMLW